MLRNIEPQIEKAKEVLMLASEMSKAYYKKPLVLAYSGGKDSDVMLRIAMECLGSDDFEVINTHTSVDAPDTVYYIRRVFKELNEKGIKTTVLIPRDKDGKQITMWRLIVKNQMPPTRLARYCCKELKEVSTPNRIVCVGVRRDESVGRGGRDHFTSFEGGVAKKHGAHQFSLEHTKAVFHDALEDAAKHNEPIETPSPMDCTMIANAKAKGDITASPIYEWSEYDVWNYIKTRGLSYNPLYNKGYKRVGCVGCPLGNRRSMLKEFADFPTYKKAYIAAFGRMLAKRRSEGKDDVTGREGWTIWRTGEDVFNWWIGEGNKNVYGQMSFEDLEENNDGINFKQ